MVQVASVYPEPSIIANARFEYSLHIPLELYNACIVLVCAPMLSTILIHLILTTTACAQWTIMTPFTERLKNREVKALVQNHTASKEQGQDSNLGSLVPGSTLPWL